MKALLKVLIYISTATLLSCSSTQNLSKASRYGSSFKNAIVVISISQEYDYVRNRCSDCQVLGQSLVFHEKKPYDILILKKPDGSEVEYYFDISSFYGKGF
jgi:hypothetical protein